MRMLRTLFLVLLPCALLSQEYRGSITGSVVDSRTREPLPGVNIMVVEKEGLGTSTDLDGTFVIRELAVGTYSLRVSAIGFETRIITNVVVTTGRETPVPITLTEGVIEMQEVTVRAGYFDRAAQLEIGLFDIPL